MTATMTADERRQGPAPSRPHRDLPVLFHLMDVSRPKGYAAAPTQALPPDRLDPPAPQSLDEHCLEAEQDFSEPTGGEIASTFDLEMAASLVETKGFGITPLDPPPPLESVETDSLADDTAASEPIAHHDPAEPSTDPVLETSPPAEDAVTLRQRVADRERKRQTPIKDDWFRSQGKFIAIGFVLALIATIYFARTGRKPAALPVAAQTHAHPGEAVQPKAAMPVVAITNLGPSQASPASQPRAALHPPTIPQLAQQSETAASGDNLFPWGDKQDERVATRQGDQPAAPSAAPSLQPQYPTTNYRGEYQPAAPAAAPAQGVPSATGPALVPAASVMPSYPTTNTARGSRYERNGSGLY